MKQWYVLYIFLCFYCFQCKMFDFCNCHVAHIVCINYNVIICYKSIFDYGNARYFCIYHDSMAVLTCAEKTEFIIKFKVLWKMISEHVPCTKLCDTKIDQINKSHSAPVPYPTMLHLEQKCAHFCSEWCIVGYGTGAQWDLFKWPLDSTWSVMLMRLTHHDTPQQGL